MKSYIRRILNEPQVWGSIVSIAVMAVIALAFFYPDSIDGNTLHPVSYKNLTLPTIRLV